MRELEHELDRDRDLDWEGEALEFLVRDFEGLTLFTLSSRLVERAFSTSMDKSSSSFGGNSATCSRAFCAAAFFVLCGEFDVWGFGRCSKELRLPCCCVDAEDDDAAAAADGCDSFEWGCFWSQGGAKDVGCFVLCDAKDTTFASMTRMVGNVYVF